jgi:hypothetical protein
LPYDPEWEDSEDFEILEDILFTNVETGDYTEEQLHNYLANLGPYETWESVQFTIDENADVVMKIWDVDGDTRSFTVSHVTDQEWRGAYNWVDERGIEFDIIVDSP